MRAVVWKEPGVLAVESVPDAKPEPGALERLAWAGVDRAHLQLDPVETDAVERQLDEYARLLQPA